MRISRSPSVAGLALLAILLLVVMALPTVGAEADAEAVSVWRVTVDDEADVAALVEGGYDLVEARGPDYLLVVGLPQVAAELRADGFSVELDHTIEPRAATPTQAGRAGYYGGYLTTAELYAHLDTVVADHGELASLIDYGDSWLKTQSGGGGDRGHNLMAICLTRIQPGDCELNPDAPKPRALIMAAIHAREMQTSEVARRLVDELTDGYGTDPELTHLMDTVETWVIPVANPDGRVVVESGGNTPLMHRKNVNDSAAGDCETPSSAVNHHGVDLNRNATTNWGRYGTSNYPCSQTYPGTGPASEPEQAALEALFIDLWGDRFAFDEDNPRPVPDGVDGSFISIHSYSDLIITPGGHSTAPDDEELRAFAARMSHYNGYMVGVADELLYDVSGTTDEFVYFELGVASFTYELSPRQGECSGFAPAYECVDSLLWPLNRDALLYSVKVAGDPYGLPAGPTVGDVVATASVAGGDPVIVTAVADDAALGDQGYSLPTPTDIARAQVFVDALPGPGVARITMDPSDGRFDTATETVTAAIDTSGMVSGRHTAYVRARNADGHWGPVTATWFEVVDGVEAGDLDSDGDRDGDDLDRLLDALIGRGQAPGPVGDVDGDGDLTLADALALGRVVLAGSG